MKHVQSVVDDKFYMALRVHAIENGMPLSELIRRALELYMDMTQTTNRGDFDHGEEIEKID